MLVQLSDRMCSTPATVQGLESIRLDWTTFFCLHFNHDTTACVVHTQNMPLFTATVCTASIGHMKALCLLQYSSHAIISCWPICDLSGEHTVPALSYDPFSLSRLLPAGGKSVLSSDSELLR
ncbi:Uncharacterized protein DAT39_000368 [Clarias magur]|uniref:Uncharacterized protein n=1 Tax=Clarias magur TaxID=1594786 RepID=A0A8J4XH64_CLAMG|nr:Uncharacterized protein DAT39_000368 [Clarias magur]